jgi:hypothetical protein
MIRKTISTIATCESMNPTVASPEAAEMVEKVRRGMKDHHEGDRNGTPGLNVAVAGHNHGR